MSGPFKQMESKTTRSLMKYGLKKANQNLAFFRGPLKSQPPPSPVIFKLKKNLLWDESLKTFVLKHQTKTF